MESDLVGKMLDLSHIEDAQESGPLPKGDYHVVCSAIESKRSSSGNNYWAFTLKVLDGPHKGRTLNDQITFVETGLKRVKWVLQYLVGIDTSKPVELSKAFEAFRGKQAIASVKVESVPSSTEPGKMYTINRVEFAGYKRPEGFQELPWPSTTDVAPMAEPRPMVAAKKNGLAF
jgi:Protein of unknown function (DUF669)